MKKGSRAGRIRAARQERRARAAAPKPVYASVPAVRKAAVAARALSDLLAGAVFAAEGWAEESPGDIDSAALAWRRAGILESARRSAGELAKIVSEIDDEING